MMDRKKKDDLPKMQVGFIDFICTPVYKVSRKWSDKYLTIIPRARMGSESIAHWAFGLMGYWLRGHEGERNNCFSKIQLGGQKYLERMNCV